MPKNSNEINETTPATLAQEIENTEEPVFETPNSKEPTEEEKKEHYIRQLKEAQKFKPSKHKGKTTINKFGTQYKKVRKSKNKQQRQSRKANR